MVVDAPTNRASRRRMEREMAEYVPTVTLSVPERIALLSILPKEGNIVTLKILRDLGNELGLTEGEVKQGEIELGNGMLRWNPEAIAEMDKDVSMGEAATKVVVEALTALSDQNKMGMVHLALYERFVSEEETE